MTPNWKAVCIALLSHFDELEGTTGLYLDHSRERFAEQFRKEQQDEILEMLADYHDATG